MVEDSKDDVIRPTIVDNPADEGTLKRESVPRILPVLPLGDVVLFPSMLLPLIVNTSRSVRLIDDVVSTNRYFLAVLQKEQEKAGEA